MNDPQSSFNQSGGVGGTQRKVAAFLLEGDGAETGGDVEVNWQLAPFMLTSIPVVLCYISGGVGGTQGKVVAFL